MFCPNCGTEQLQGTTFCSNCGTELSNIKNIGSPKTNNSISAKDPFNGHIKQQIPNMPTMPSMPTLPNIGMPQMQYPNQMVNPNMQNMGIPMSRPHQMANPNMPNMGRQQMPYPNQMVNPNIQNMGIPMPHPNQMVNPNMQNIGIPMQYPNQMVNLNKPNMGMPMQQQININIVEKPNKKNKKNKFLASFLAFFFGGLGAHKFYLGKYGWGLLYALFPFFSITLAVCTDSEGIFMLSFLPSFVSIVESVMYLCMSNEDFQKK